MIKILLIIGFVLMITFSQLKSAAPYGDDNILQCIEDYSELFDQYNVDTPRRLRYFLAQVAHESAGFRTTREYASGKAYEGRRDLGNIKKGDGVRYRGRGLIQLTGRYNYRKYGELLGKDLENNPDLAEKFPVALEIALAYWKLNGLNVLADKGHFRTITKRINGGYNGYADRLKWLMKMRRVIKWNQELGTTKD